MELLNAYLLEEVFLNHFLKENINFGLNSFVHP